MNNYIVSIDGLKSEPISRDQVIKLWQEGELKTHDCVSEAYSSNWIYAAKVEWLADTEAPVQEPVAEVATNTGMQRQADAAGGEAVSRLTRCADCGKEMSKSAATCPSCGAANNDVHPEIKRFLKAPPYLAMINCEYTYDTQSIRFTRKPSKFDRQKRGGSLTMFATINAIIWLYIVLLMVMNGGATPVLIIAGVVFSGISSLIMKLYGSRGDKEPKYLEIRFDTDPPTWESSGHESWKPLIRFFDCKP